ncbi:hypothetical protein THOG11_120038 [Vibrio harveyi]|nr:hypothetical protein VHARVF571_560039 [Vibrio harveyi]CAH1548218.1 hypothetical protein THOD03_110038 [Vibrio harveyi]CAH1552344.1 hypothetical protein THOG11_120038 [Vibrio harveyi]
MHQLIVVKIYGYKMELLLFNRPIYALQSFRTKSIQQRMGLTKKDALILLRTQSETFR